MGVPDQSAQPQSNATVPFRGLRRSLLASPPGLPPGQRIDVARRGKYTADATRVVDPGASCSLASARRAARQADISGTSIRRVAERKHGR